MTLVAFLLAYVIRRRLDSVNRLSGDRLWRAWFQRYTVAGAGEETSVRGGIIKVVVPAVALALMAYLAGAWGMRAALFPLDVFMLVALMGAPGWKTPLALYSDAWQRGDMQAAWRHIEQQLPAEDRGAALSPEAMHLSLSKALMLSVFYRFFLVAFWYFVGGIALAFLARGLVALSDHWPQAPARPAFRRWANLVAWLPVRLLACTFGLAGDLAGWSRDIRRVLPGFGKSVAYVLSVAANGSLTGYALDPQRFSTLHPDEWPSFGGRSLTAIRDLLNRSMLVWICGAALLVIAGVL
ncbi:MAG: histidine kinase [Marinobacter sp. 34-60-7]|nr:MAG: histidine kinase [Marinobacter sp. 34-60-7]